MKNNEYIILWDIVIVQDKFSSKEARNFEKFKWIREMAEPWDRQYCPEF